MFAMSETRLPEPRDQVELKDLSGCSRWDQKHVLPADHVETCASYPTEKCRLEFPSNASEKSLLKKILDHWMRPA